jgi:hypothetical protein
MLFLLLFRQRLLTSRSVSNDLKAGYTANANGGFMKFRIAFLILLLSVVMLSPMAQAFRFSVGAFGGLNLPVAQEDTKSGTVMGLKARIPLTTYLAVEPNYTYLKNGDGEVKVETLGDITMTRDGGKYSTFGIDVVFGGVSGYKGFNAYGILGVASAKFAKKGLPDLTKGSLWLGVGFEFGITEYLSADFRGKALIFPYKDDDYGNGNTGSRKNGTVTVGLNYYFGISEE